MQSIQLYIKDENDVFQQVELFNDESITLNQSIQDVKDISKIFTDYSQTFSVPASKINNKLFKHFYNYFIDGFDAREKKDAKLYLNFKPFKTGKIKLEGSSLKENKPNTYKLTFYGDTVSLKDLIGDVKLSGLTYFNNSTFTYSAAQVKTLLGSAGNINVAGTRWDDSLIFPLITHTDRLYYDTGTDGANANNLANIRWNAAGNTAQGVSYTQLKPAIRVMMFFSAIEYQYPAIQFSQDFITSTNTDLYNLFMWLNKNEGDFIQSTDLIYQYFQPYTNIERSPKADRKRSEFCDVLSNGSFNVLQGRITKTLTASFTSSGAGEYTVLLKRDGEVVSQFEGLTGSSSPIINLELQTGRHTIQVAATTAANFTMECEVLARYSGTDAKVTWKSTASVLSTTEVSIKDHLPDIKVLDWLTGMFKMFNLTAYIDKDGITRVQTLDSFYAGTTDDPIKYYDITENVDVKTSQIDVVLPFNQINFKYEGTKTYLAQDHKNRFGTEWGSLNYKNQQFEGDTFEVKLPFEHFKYERLYNQTGGTSTTIQWGWSVDKEKSSTVTKPLIFYPILATNVSVGGTPTSISFIGASGHEEVTSYYLPSNSKSFSSVSSGEDVSNNLNFKAEMNEYALRPFNKTLFKQYYENYIKDIFKAERRLTKLSAYIPDAIITNLKLSDRLIVGDKVYKINKISTNFETQLSKLELINVFDEREIPQNLNQAVATVDTDIEGVGLTADTTLVTADAGIEYENVIEMPKTEIPKTIPSNTPTPENNVPCTVTAATLDHPTQLTNTNSIIYFKHSITAMGKICEVSTLESYGFLHAATEALVTGADLATLKGTSGVTNIEYIPNDPLSSTNVKSYTTQITGLSQNTIKYWRFYAVTNSTSNFDVVNIISNIYAAKSAASPNYSETTNPQTYINTGGESDNEYRTIRIMDKDQNIIEVSGIRSVPIRIHSKIVPYVIDGLPFPSGAFTTYDNLGAAGSCGIVYTDNRDTYYHATDRDAAINAAKAGSVGNTGATQINVGTSTNYDEKSGAGLSYNNIGLFVANIGSAIFGTTKATDGFYATRLTPYSTEDDSYAKDWASFTPRTNPMVKSVKLLNGLTTDGKVS